MQRTTLAAVIAGLFTLPVQAQDVSTPGVSTPIPLLDEIVVTATRVPTPDVLAPYASEVHTRQMIEQSGSSTLYDYLAQHSSVQVLPSFGNKFTPKIDMRGYGIGDGYQNIVVTLDGRRMNNIDMSSQLISAIPLADIERIEVTKGSGSVMFGDGATAGSIQIITRSHEGISVQAMAGNFGLLAGTVTAGLKRDRVNLSASADYSGSDGYSEKDPSGHTDASSNRTWRGAVELRPLDRLQLGLDLASTRVDARYVSPLTLAQFESNPAQVGSNPWTMPANAYTHQKLESDLWRVSAGLELSRDWSLTASHSREDKMSDFITSSYKADYDYNADDLALQYRGEHIDLSMGMQRFEGVRIDRNGWSDNDSGKKNSGWYAQGSYRAGATSVSVGARTENVAYTYTPTVGAGLGAKHDLDAWDLGVNHQLDAHLTFFANYNRAFQAPDIDRFFNFGGSFNGFIDPAKSRTLNLGLNRVTATNRLKFTLFRADVDNEIFYNAATFTNTNLDRTHKYGLELQDVWRVSEPLSINLNYAYTRAIIDHDNDGGGTYDGKDLPGVPRHSVNLGLTYKLSVASSINLSQTWRSATYAAEDFANTYSQKQSAYLSTDIAWRYRLNSYEFFASVDNLFEHKNGLWIHDDAIYPVNFTRNWRIGMKATF